MDRIIVYVDDADHAARWLGAMLRQSTPARSPARTEVHWVLVACPPRMTQRIGKWVSHAAREQWRARWAAKLFTRVLPVLRAHGDLVTPVVATGSLPAVTRRLLAAHGECRVIDARRPKVGVEPATVAPIERQADHGSRRAPASACGEAGPPRSPR